MTDQLDVKVKLFLLAAPFCLSLIGLSLDLYIACSRDFKVMTSALQRSDCLPFAKFLYGQQGLRSKTLIISVISSELMFPNARIRRGSLDAQDYLEFPKGLRTRMVIAAWFNIAGFTWLIVNGFIL
ncbi:hypothetical protein ACIF8Z_02260 [Pseudomonas promysalinigenes]|jgi:hypothetical protein|uniref:hypothetical protein n=1 Tax=Pseudomonas promysalinigenes TaxID=485898 RepID=UPI0037C5C1ED